MSNKTVFDKMGEMGFEGVPISPGLWILEDCVRGFDLFVRVGQNGKVDGTPWILDTTSEETFSIEVLPRDLHKKVNGILEECGL